MPRETFVAIRNLIAQSEPIPPDLAAKDELNKQKAKTFDRIAQANMGAMRILKEGGVLGGGPFGKEAKETGWRNVGEHNGAALFVSRPIGELCGLPRGEQRELEHAAGMHDYDKRIQLEESKLGKRRTSEGIMIIEYDASKVAQDEVDNTGLVGVTKGDLRGHEKWGYQQMALRYTDSILVPIPKTAHTDIVHWRDRINELRKRHPDADKEQGRLYGEGVRFYDVLERIMEEIEPKLYERAILVRPELRKKYPRSDMYFQIVKDRIMANIKNTPLKTQKAS